MDFQEETNGGWSARRADLISRLLEGNHEERADAFLVEAPLRICPLGAHVDHQGGVVTGMTVDRQVVLAVAPTTDSIVRISSLDFAGDVVLDLRESKPARAGDWGDYVRAALSVLSSKYPLMVGFRAVVAGDLPGAGLSSSAAVLVAYFFALSRVNGIELSRAEISAFVQEAENSYIGVASGRLDQSIILFAEPSCLTRVDCSDLSIEQISRPPGSPDYRVLVAFSGVRRTLAGSGFNARVDECREAARILLERVGASPCGVPVLSDVAPEIFAEYGARLPRALRRRAAHYFSEERRVLKGVEAWSKGDLHRFGALMNSSGASSIHNYECGTAELVTLYELLRDARGVFGTRFSGGGFGGCCVALIDPAAGEKITEDVARRYEAVHPEAAAAASFHICQPGGPARFSDLGI